MADRFGSVDEYVMQLPADVQVVMERIRASVHSVVPDVGEKISYNMPTFTLDGLPLVHVAAWKKHIGLYPLPAMDGALADEVAPYRAATDTMQLKYAQPIPYDLVESVMGVILQQRREGGR